MGRPKSNSTSRAVWALAQRQHGVVTRAQLSELGYSREAIDHRLRSGRLHLITRGVYAVGWPGLTQERRWMASVLASGPDAVLSHRSAARLWGLIRAEGPLVEVSVAGRRAGKRPGIVVHSRKVLGVEQVTRRNGIPVTAVDLTLVDLATRTTAKVLERAVNEADKLDLIDPETLRERLDAYRGLRGIRSLRLLLDRDTFRLSDSELERRFHPIAAAAGLPVAETKAWIEGLEVDFLWPQLRLVVETDGLRYHRTPSSQSRDREREQSLVAAGFTVLRFSHHQVRYQPNHVRDVLERTATRLRNAQTQPPSSTYTVPSDGESGTRRGGR